MMNLKRAGAAALMAATVALGSAAAFSAPAMNNSSLSTAGHADLVKVKDGGAPWVGKGGGGGGGNWKGGGGNWKGGGGNWKGGGGNWKGGNAAHWQGGKGNGKWYARNGGDGRGGRYRHRNHGYGYYPGAIIGFGLGLDDDYDYGGYGYSNYNNEASDEAVERCAARFRSFEPDTGLYTTYGGHKRLCPYLR